MALPEKIALWIIVANILAFLAFGADKRLAENGSWRIPENTLLILALVGGSIGATIAQHWFRHKTRKEPFRSTLYGIVALQIIGVAIWLIKPDLLQGLAG
jgi:uncharacterized membrane protein YsdA (DUF1294 family)